MKRCPMCNAYYPDSSYLCHVDGERLQASNQNVKQEMAWLKYLILRKEMEELAWQKRNAGVNDPLSHIDRVLEAWASFADSYEAEKC